MGLTAYQDVAEGRMGIAGQWVGRCNRRGWVVDAFATWIRRLMRHQVSSAGWWIMANIIVQRFLLIGGR